MLTQEVVHRPVRVAAVDLCDQTESLEVARYAYCFDFEAPLLCELLLALSLLSCPETSLPLHAPCWPYRRQKVVRLVPLFWLGCLI